MYILYNIKSNWKSHKKAVTPPFLLDYHVFFVGGGMWQMVGIGQSANNPVQWCVVLVGLHQK